MRRLIVLLVALGAILPAVAAAAVGVSSLREADVVVDSGADVSAADRERLQRTADELGGKGFPTKFVVLAERRDQADAFARELRSGLAREVGIDSIDAVLVLTPGQLGIDADVFAAERQEAFEAEVAALRADPVQGAINVARRLQAFDEAGALPGVEESGGDGGIAPVLIALLAAVGAGVIVVAALAVRSARRGKASRAQE